MERGQSGIGKGMMNVHSVLVKENQGVGTDLRRTSGKKRRRRRAR